MAIKLWTLKLKTEQFIFSIESFTVLLCSEPYVHTLYIPSLSSHWKHWQKSNNRATAFSKSVKIKVGAEKLIRSWRLAKGQHEGQGQWCCWSCFLRKVSQLLKTVELSFKELLTWENVKKQNPPEHLALRCLRESKAENHAFKREIKDERIFTTDSNVKKIDSSLIYKLSTHCNYLIMAYPTALIGNTLG